jgi:predicted nucleotidyltransferase
MLNLPTDLREFAASLAGRDVRYVVVGGYAVAYHGYPRYTGDIDFLVEASEENAARLVEALGDFGFGSLGLTVADFVSEGFVIQLGFPPNRIDLLTSVEGVTFEDAWAARERCEVDGVPLWMISLDHLLAAKRAAGRPKDRLDVRHLTRRARRLAT